MEIVIRALVIFVFLWLVTRAIGRSTLGELSTFELLLFVCMGDLVQNGVTQQDFTLTGAVLAVSTFALCTVTLSYVAWRWPRTRAAVHGISVVVVTNGEPNLSAMRAERLSMDELMAAAREQGVETFGEIRLAVLEDDGKISFFTRHGSSSGAPDKPSV